MAEGDPACSAEFQAQLRVATEWPLFLQEVQQISRRLGPWMQQRTSLQRPELTLQLERVSLESEEKNALNDLRNCIRRLDIPDPSETITDHRARVRIATKRVENSFVKLEDFDRDRGKKLKELQDTYNGHVKELLDTFPIPAIPEYVHRLALSRLSASNLKTLLGGNNGTQLCYERSWSEANENNTSISASLLPASSLLPPPRRSGSSQATSLERKQTEEGPEKISENGETINVRVAGISIPAGDVASSSATEEAAVSQHTRALVTPRLSLPR